MPGCAAIGCNNRSEKGFTMKCFPRNAKLRKIWTERVSRADWEPSNNSFLCHVHFEADQWTITQSGRIKLKKNAIPSIFTITSTRKSPKKRRKPANGEDKDLYIIEYLDEPLNHKSSSKLQHSTYNCYTASDITTAIGRQAYNQKATNIAMQKREEYDTFVISDETSETSVKETKISNGSVSNNKISEKMNDTEGTSEKNSRVISDRELDDIEEKLRSICDGETQIDNKSTTESKNPIKSEINDNVISENSTDGSKCKRELSSIDNNEISIKKQESSDAKDTINGKEQSEFEIKKSEEKTFPASEKTNGVVDSKMNVENPCEKTSNKPKRATFTIKLTGIDEDVTEIIEGLGAEPILKYKSSNELSNSNKNFVTSVISVTEDFPINLDDRDEDTKANLDMRSSWSNDVKKITKINGREKKYEVSSKRSLESSDNDVDTMDFQQLRKKIKIQEEIIEKLESQLNDDNDIDDETNHVNTRSKSKRRKITQNTCNGDCQNDLKNRLLDDLSSKIKDLNDTITRLNESLIEEKHNLKNSQLLIRHRDNRIRELNWKLKRASKLIERAEKNANNHKKRMMSLQNLLTKRNIEAEINETTRDSRYIENSIISPAGSETKSIDSNATRSFEVKDDDISNESIVYRTVQDIFDESNHCDDNDPIIIDNPEDFMRQFAGSL